MPTSTSSLLQTTGQPTQQNFHTGSLMGGLLLGGLLLGGLLLGGLLLGGLLLGGFVVGWVVVFVVSCRWGVRWVVVVGCCSSLLLGGLLLWLIWWVVCKWLLLWCVIVRGCSSCNFKSTLKSTSSHMSIETFFYKILQLPFNQRFN